MSKTSWLVIAACVAGVSLVPLVFSGYVVYVVNTLLVFIVLALGLHVVLGEAGQFSLAHASFYGIGIYVSGILNNAFHAPFIVNLLAGGVAAACVGLLLSGLALRMRDIYLALSTFAFGEAMQWLLLNWEAVTGGPNGYRLSPSNFFGFQIISDKQAVFFVLAVTLIFIALTVLISRSRFGHAMRAVRESEIAAMAMGIDVKRVKMAAFAVSAFFAGCAGGMFTLFSSFIHPESLGFQTTILVLVMVVVGGVGSVVGAGVGVVAFGLIAELLRQAPAFQEMLYGVILIGFMMYAPKGLTSLRRPRVSVSLQPARVKTEQKA